MKALNQGETSRAKKQHSIKRCHGIERVLSSGNRNAPETTPRCVTDSNLGRPVLGRDLFQNRSVAGSPLHQNANAYRSKSAQGTVNVMIKRNSQMAAGGSGSAKGTRNLRLGNPPPAVVKKHQAEKESPGGTRKGRRGIWRSANQEEKKGMQCGKRVPIQREKRPQRA